MWRNKLNQILNILMGSTVGVFIGYSLYMVWDYHMHPDRYAIQSAPWYTGCLLYGTITVTVLLLCVVLKIILRKKIKQ